MAKKRVLVLISQYPQLSQTYKESEIKYLSADYEIRVATWDKPDLSYHSHHAFSRFSTLKELEKIVTDFRPDIIHGHYLHRSDVVHHASKIAGVPYTVRFHSFDVLGRNRDYFDKYSKFINHELCLGALTFPFTIAELVANGINQEKLVADWPVVDFKRFYDTSPNGKTILNVGACIRKKNMRSFVDLAAMMPHRDFALQPIGYNNDKIIGYNRQKGSPVRVLDCVEPYNMPAVYKGCEWLIYSADRDIPMVGWPMAVAEAQAAGVGVIMLRIRPDIDEFVGEAGFVVDDISEIPNILAEPFPEEKRQLGFEQARKSDIAENIKKLENLWAIQA